MLASRVRPSDRGVGVVDVGVVAPSAALIASGLTSEPDGPDVVARPVEVGGAPGSVDVLLVAAWAGPDLPDAVARLASVIAAPVVLLGRACDPDVAIEAMDHPAVAGRVPADMAPGTLAAVLAAVARGGAHPDLVVDDPRTGLHAVLSQSALLRGLARAVVVDRASTWADIARATGFSTRTVQSSPSRFAPLVRADLGLAEDHDVTQSLLHHWLGAKAGYLRAWCRRHGVS